MRRFEVVPVLPAPEVRATRAASQRSSPKTWRVSSSVSTSILWRSCIGMLYVAASLFGSTQFLATSDRFLVNDFFWPEFNATGSVVFMTKAFNVMLYGASPTTNLTSRFMLDDVMFLTTDRMDQASASIPFGPHYPRLVQYHHLTDIEAAIVGIRATTASRAPFIFTQYCWVDFQRRWSVAHTAKRADRCLKTQTTNAAVYLESLLRNIQWGDFIVAKGESFAVGIADELSKTTEGIEFLASLASNGSLSVAAEAAYWRKHGIKYHRLQYNNAAQIGVDETVEIVNAFGLRHRITIKKGEYMDRYAAQTTGALNWGWVNDLWAVVQNHTRISGLSLVRNSSSFFENHGITMEQVLIEDGDVSQSMTPQVTLLQQHLGPFGSVDMHWIRFPQDLIDLVDDVRAITRDAVMRSDEARDVFGSVSARVDKMTFYPATWRTPNRVFFGGSPLCYNSPRLTYATHQFRFEDNCGSTSMEGGAADRFSFVFASLMTGMSNSSDFGAVCEAGMTAVKACRNGFANAAAFTSQYISSQARQQFVERAIIVRDIVAQMNVSMMQFVATEDQSGNASYSLLIDSVLPINASNWWSAFGWIMMLDWVQGNREVVAFEGDEGTLTLISGFSNAITFQPQSSEVVQSMSTFFNLGVRFVTIVLIAVAVLVILNAISVCFHIEGWNMYHFNRVSAVVWVGRPLLILRGIVAICILSTSSPVLIRMGAFWGMQETTPAWYTSILAAGEATWILCVLIDLLIMFTGGLTYRFASVSHAVVWTSVAVLQLRWPVHHRVSIGPRCNYVVIDQQVECDSGIVYVGDTQRLLSILGVIGVTLVVCYLPVRKLFPRRALRADGLLLPGIAQEVFQRQDWIHDGHWCIDRASAAMAGLVAVPCQSKLTVVDVQGWALLQMDRTAIASAQTSTTSTIPLKRLKPVKRLTK